MTKSKKRSKYDEGLVWAFSIFFGLLLLYFIYKLFRKDEYYQELDCSPYEKDGSCTTDGGQALYNKYYDQIKNLYCSSPDYFSNNFSSFYDQSIGCYSCKNNVKSLSNFINSDCTSGGGGGSHSANCDSCTTVKNMGDTCDYCRCAQMNGCSTGPECSNC